MTIRLAAGDTRALAKGPPWRPNIDEKNPKISLQTLKPGPYGARKPFMRLP